MQGESEPSVHLNCGNVRIAFLAFCMIFWSSGLMFLCQMAEHSGVPKLAEQAHAVNHYFGNSTAAFMSGPVIILATFLYFHWGRKRLSWFNGVMLDDQPIDVVHYQFKGTIINVPLIYLQTAKRLYIVYPVASQDGRKIPDEKIMARETAANEIQVELLKGNLEKSGATKKAFWFFTKDVAISFLVLIIIVVTAFLVT